MTKLIPVNCSVVGMFWANVGARPRGECWYWTGAVNNKGYGTMNPSRETGPILAHRVSWTIHNGEIPDNMFMLHRCDNPLCVNPDHLFLGTQKDNIRDMINKGRDNLARDQSGEANNNSKLNPDQVKAIRSLVELGISQTRVAKIYNVCQPHVSAIVRREAWSSV